MKGLIVLSVVMLAVCSNPIRAEVAVSRGVGTETCAQFAANYQRDPSMVDLYVSWAQGYMAATNVFLELDSKKVINVFDLAVEELAQELRTYCDAHPLNEFECRLPPASTIFLAVRVMNVRRPECELAPAKPRS
jgi:hypothetical protein